MRKRGIILSSITKIKPMLKQHVEKLAARYYKVRAFVCAVVLVVMIGGAAIAHADQYDDQINALKAQNGAAQNLLNSLQAQASSYQDAINQLQAQISALEASIAANEARQTQLTQQIADNQQQIETKKAQLSEDIKTMYIDGQMSTIEELASSKDLSDYIDKEEYRTTVQNQLNEKISEILQLQAQLQAQKAQLDTLLTTEKQQNDQLGSAQAQQQQLLSYNQGQQDAYDAQIRANQSQIASLRAQQLAANRRLGGRVIYGGSCGGGYPADALNGYGAHWGCNYYQDNTYDNWGMYNRECVSYTAWKVYEAYGYMPYWGGVGNADQWPGDAQAAGIPTGSTPKVHSVAIGTNPYYFGPVGHAMWVEAVNDDGTILVSQYNFGAAGQYSTMTVSSAGLTFIYFD